MRFEIMPMIQIEVGNNEDAMCPTIKIKPLTIKSISWT